MTTPAVNLDQQLYVTVYPWDTLGGCPGTFQVSGVGRNVMRQRLQEVRPASVNNPKQRGSNWRNPSAWSHSKLFHNPVPNNTVIMHRNAFCGSTPKLRIHYDGYAWYGLPTSSIQALPGFMRQVAESKALMLLKMNRPNLAVAFAERKETARTIESALKSIATSVRRFRHTNPKLWGQVVKEGLKNQSGKTPSQWLALQYGWKPLMNDVYTSCDALSTREQDSKILSTRVRGTCHVKDVTYSTRSASLGSLCQMQVTDTNEHFVKVILEYNLKNSALQAFASLGLTNPLELAWERVPYSFVVDWFLPLGSWLSTLDADVGWEFKSGTRTEFSRLTSNSKVVYASPATMLSLGYIDMTAIGDTYKARGFNMNRSVYSSSPWVGLPSFKNPLSSTHIANAMSLLVEAFRR